MCAKVGVWFQLNCLTLLDIEMTIASVRVFDEEAFDLPSEAASAVFVQGLNHEEDTADFEHRGSDQGSHTCVVKANQFEMDNTVTSRNGD